MNIFWHNSSKKKRSIKPVRMSLARSVGWSVSLFRNIKGRRIIWKLFPASYFLMRIFLADVWPIFTVNSFFFFFFQIVSGILWSRETSSENGGAGGASMWCATMKYSSITTCPILCLTVGISTWLSPLSSLTQILCMWTRSLISFPLVLMWLCW